MKRYTAAIAAFAVLFLAIDTVFTLALCKAASAGEP